MAFNTTSIRRRIKNRAGHDGRQRRSGKVVEMNKPVKQLVARTEDEQLKVFVRASPQELTIGDIEVVAGGARAMFDPYG